MVELSQSLALVAARLGEDARAALLVLLSGQLQDQVADLVRRVDPESEAVEDYQRQLLAGFTPPVRVEASEQEDAEEDAEEGDGPDSESTDASQDLSGLIALLAMLCATASKAHCSALLLHLPLHLQGQVIAKLLKASPLSAAAGLMPMHRELVEALRAAMPNREEWGVESVCQIMRVVDSTRQLRRLITIADDADHESVVVLQNHLFDFEDLLSLSDRDLQALLVQVDNHTLGQSLLLTDKEVHGGLLRNVSARRRTLIAEEEECWAESTMQEIEMAQQRMMAMARHLYEQGKITTYFGSVSRTGLSDDHGDEEQEEQEEEQEKEEVEEEDQHNYRGVLVGGAVLLVAIFAVWGIVSLFASGGDKGRRASSGGQGAGKRGGGGVGMVATGGVAVEGRSAGAVRPTGQTMRMQAVVEMSGQARLEALNQTEVVAVDDEEAAFEMRVGKVRTMVLDEDFEMRTPVVIIKGVVRGALFDTRVVLDASTTVEVVRGSVVVYSLLRDGLRWTVGKGMQGYFDTAGNGRVEKIITAGG